MNLEHFEKLKTDFDDEFNEEQTKPVEKPKPLAQNQNTQTKPAENTTKPQTLTNSENNELNVDVQGMYAPIELAPKANIKVLIGKYSTFDDAKNAQNVMKTIKKTAPFIRKVDNVYCLQIGSYSNMDVARSVAGGYAKDGFDVWIYQQ